MNIVFLAILTVCLSFLVIKKYIIPYVVRIKELNTMKRESFQVEAIVVDFKIDQDTDGATYFLQVVEYRVDGIFFKSVIDDPIKEKPQIGEKITVFCNKRNPDFVVRDVIKVLEKYYVGLFFLSVVLLLIISAFVVVIVN